LTKRSPEVNIRGSVKGASRRDHNPSIQKRMNLKTKLVTAAQFFVWVGLITSCAVEQLDVPDPSLGGLSRILKVQGRSISSENFTGQRGEMGMFTNGPGRNAACVLGQGWIVCRTLNNHRHGLLNEHPFIVTHCDPPWNLITYRPHQ
jgi:hypothetical protein